MPEENESASQSVTSAQSPVIAPEQAALPVAESAVEEGNFRQSSSIPEGPSVHFG
jgi:hypothetical protein